MTMFVESGRVQRRMPRMKTRRRTSAWAKLFQRSVKSITRHATTMGARAVRQALKPVASRHAAPGGAGAWIPGVVMGAAGARRFRLFRPPALQPGKQLPLMVMLHGCGQDAASFASSTRMNRVALREGFLVLYPEQERLANAQGCWNWFDTDSGRAEGEASLIMQAIDQVCLLHPVDRASVAIAGLSAGASMAALVATREPGRFKAVVMHSGVPPGTAHSTVSALRAMRGLRMTAPLAATPLSMASNWPALLVIHGNADAVVSPHNGLAAANAWAEAAGAQAEAPRRIQRGKRHAVWMTEFKRKGSTVATLAAVEGLAHAWSGGAASLPYGDPQGPDASRMVWAFAARQFRA
jgi:poly(hydroxyalkanoate) depolymerase family esterase